MSPTTKDATVYFQFPLWMIGKPLPNIRSLARMSTGSGMKGVLLFTDEVLAKEFLNGTSGLSGNVLRPIVDPWHFFGVLVLLEQAGFTLLAIDPAPAQKDGTNSSDVHAIQIAALRDDVRNMAY